jgi:hypothetical protein
MSTVRKILAVLVALRATTNFGKAFSETARFVVLGQLLGGVWTSVVAPLFGIAMLIYAYGLWQARAWALGAGVVYAIWATINVIAFPLVEGVPARFAPWMYALFAIPGLIGPWLAVWALAKERA